MTWAPPEWDGGAPITHYVIEMKEKNMGQWVEGKTMTIQEVQQAGNLIKGKQTGLIEGCEYQFRVRAVNKGGPSKPSPPSLPMIAKTRFCKYLVRKCMSEMPNAGEICPEMIFFVLFAQFFPKIRPTLELAR